MEKDDYTVSSSCCGPDTLPTSVVDPSKFKPRGSVVPQAAGTDLNVYVTRPSSGKLRRSDEALLVIYDIVGYGHPNNFQAADVLADKMGLLTVMPDFFRGVPFPPERFDWSGAARLDSPNTVPSPTAGKPAEERNVMGLVRSLDKEIGAWVMRGGGNWDKVVRKDVGDVLGWLKRAHGVKRCAMIGFCYGGVVIVKAAQEFQDTIKAVCGVHPAFMGLNDAAKIRVPIAILPSSIDDPDFSKFVDVLRTNKYIPKAPSNDKPTIIHKLFTDVRHGWCTARGNYDNPLVAKRANEAFDIATKFFRDNLALAESEDKSAGRL